MFKCTCIYKIHQIFRKNVKAFFGLKRIYKLCGTLAQLGGGGDMCFGPLPPKPISPPSSAP